MLVAMLLDFSNYQDSYIAYNVVKVGRAAFSAILLQFLIPKKECLQNAS
jgi:hypothetical protein